MLETAVISFRSLDRRLSPLGSGGSGVKRTRRPSGRSLDSRNRGCDNPHRLSGAQKVSSTALPTARFTDGKLRHLRRKGDPRCRPAGLASTAATLGRTRCPDMTHSSGSNSSGSVTSGTYAKSGLWTFGLRLSTAQIALQTVALPRSRKQMSILRDGDPMKALKPDDTCCAVDRLAFKRLFSTPCTSEVLARGILQTTTDQPTASGSRSALIYHMQARWNRQTGARIDGKRSMTQSRDAIPQHLLRHKQPHCRNPAEQTPCLSAFLLG